MFWNEKDKTIGNFQRNLSLLNLLGRAPQAALTRFNKDIFFNKDFLYKIIKRICSQILQFIYVNQEYGPPFQKKILTFLRTKYFFDAGSSCFCRQEIPFCATSTFFLLTWNTFSRNINTFLSTPDYFLRDVKLFVPTQNYFSCNIKFMFWTSFKILCHDDISSLSHSNKNIIMCQKKKKKFIFMWHKKINCFFVHHKLFIFSVYIVHWHHVNLLRSGLGNKGNFNPSFTHLSDIPKQLLSNSCSRKKISYYLGLMFVKRLWRAHIYVKLQACFSQILQKLTL